MFAAARPQPRISPDEELYWHALRLIPGLGARRTASLLEKFKGIQSIFRSTVSELESAGVGPGQARSIVSGCTFDEAVEQQRKLKAVGGMLLTLHDPQYPVGLRTIIDPPPVLFARGRLEVLDAPGIAIVGTRRATPYGISVTEKFSTELAAAGCNVVSGMARGIDTAAHRAALAVNGCTTAVFGCGIDVTYPTENRRIHEELATRALVLSEFPMGSPAYPQNFPIRNRIVSGMSVGVLVVEGAQYSGSTITARLAVEQGKELFAVPGNITSQASWGPNLLIRQGAKLVTGAQDILSELPVEVRRRIQNGNPESNRGRLQQKTLALGPNNPLGEKILATLQIDSSTHVDDLLSCLENYSSSEIVAVLFELELLGLVRQLPGKQFVKVW